MNKIFSLVLTFFLLSTAVFSQKINIDDLDGLKIRNIGPAGMSGRVTAIDVDLSNPNIIFAGTASGGIWRSTNGGINWKPVFDDAPTQSIGAIAINQNNPAEIWAGTGEGNPRNSQNSGAGVYHSLDGGKNWTFKGLKNTRVIHRILLDPSRPGTVYVGAQGSAWGTSEERGVFKTSDNGEKCHHSINFLY